MGTLFDYVKWRGDLSFTEAPFNEVDSLIFSLISYIDFEGIVAKSHGGIKVPIKAAANAYFTKMLSAGKVPKIRHCFPVLKSAQNERQKS